MARYKFKGSRVIGLDSNGVERTSILWAPMTPSVGHNLGLGHSCRDLGTETCLDCTKQIADESCQFMCENCEHKQTCPCSLVSWERRNEHRLAPGG